MADERITPSGWLPPAAPGGGRPPRFDAPAPGRRCVRPRPGAAGAPAEPNVQAVWALVLAHRRRSRC